MKPIEPSSSGLSCALADMRIGTIVGMSGTTLNESLEGLAAATPELFATDRISWELVFGRLKRAEELEGLRDLVLVSKQRVHVALRSQQNPSLVLIGTAPRTRSIGAIVSEARVRLHQLESGQQLEGGP
jgi:hypothetical protein